MTIQGKRKSGNFTAGVGRQYIGEIGKTDLSSSAKNNGLTVTQDPRHLPENERVAGGIIPPAISRSNTRSDHYFQASSNGIVVVTTHLYDGRKSLPLDLELYQHMGSLPQGKQDPLFEKKTELALKLIDRSLERKYQPGIVIVDAGYGNNTSFLLEAREAAVKVSGRIS